MTYRLPTRTATVCIHGDCSATVSYVDGDPGTRTQAYAGWTLGPETAVCPEHSRRTPTLLLAA